MVQKLHICEKVHFDQLLDFSNIASHFIMDLLVAYLTIWMLDFGCQTVWIQIRPDILSR